MQGTITTNAPAKLNLALGVGPLGPGGLHPTCSWMVTVDLVDDLEVTRLPPDRLSRYAILWHEEARRPTEIDWSIRHDLTVRAHLALEERLGRRMPVQLKLEKRIPVGSGLGGGSANAAAMLHALNELFALGLDDDELADVGAGLGADVPFLVFGGSAIVEGTGDRVEIVPIPELDVVIAFPEAHCASGDIYAQFDAMTPDAALHAARVRALVKPRPDPGALFNDLAAAACAVAPVVAGDLERLTRLAERPAHVTGSGASIFVVCDDPLHASVLAEAWERDSGVPAVAAKATTRATPIFTQPA